MGWTQISESYVGISGGSITVTEMCKEAPNCVWYGTSTGKVFRLDSADSATPVMHQITGANFPTNAYVSCIAVNPFDSSQVMVTFSNYNIPSAFYTNDGGQTWTDVGGNLEENIDGTGSGPAVYWAYLYPDGTKYLGTSVGLYSVKALNGTNTIWEQEGPTTIGNVVINMIEARTHDGLMVVGTHGNGIYSAHTVPAFVGIDEADEVDNSVKVYPNPAVDFITVDADLPVKTSFRILDMNGRVVKDLGIGPGKFNLDISGLPAGTYVYRYHVGNAPESGMFIKQ